MCDNNVLLVKSLKNGKKHFTNRLPKAPHNIVNRYSCSDSTKNICMFDSCTDSKNGKLLKPGIQGSHSDLDFDSDSYDDHDAEMKL